MPATDVNPSDSTQRTARRDDAAPARDVIALRDEAIRKLGDGIWITDLDGAVLYRNEAALQLETRKWTHAGGVAGSMRDAVFETDLQLRLMKWGEYVAEFELSCDVVEIVAANRINLRMRMLQDDDGEPFGISLHARDTSQEWSREQVLHDRHVELEQAYARLEQAQLQLLQSEKMASIGQLAAGVAHEINNPIGYVHSNLGTLHGYVQNLLSLLDAYEQMWTSIVASDHPSSTVIENLKKRIDYTFLQHDLPQLVEESRDGIGRVKKIVHDLRDFSHAGELESEDWVHADLHRGIESTLNIVWNELKYKVELSKDYGELPPVECMPSQLNQVFMNLLVNAGQAIGDHGRVSIVTRHVGDEVQLSFGDNGHGIAAEHLQRIFDPFFTTKPVGKGTGLGLSLSYGIIQKHQGRITVESKVGVGTTFHIHLPVRRPG